MNIIRKTIQSFKSGLSFLGIKKSHFTTLSALNGNFGFDSFKMKKALVEGYGQNDTLYSIIKKASTSMASNIRWKVMEIDLRSGEKKEVFDTGLNLLLEKPNNYQSQNEFREQIYNYLFLTGRSFVGGIRPVGFKDFNSLHNLPSDRTTFELGNIVNPYKSFKVDWNLTREWDGEDVLFSKYVNMTISDEKDLFDGQSPLQAGNRLLQSSNHRDEAQASFFKSRGVSSLLTNRSDEVMMPTEKLKSQASLDGDLSGPEQFNKTKITTGNVELIKLGLDPSDLKMLEFGTQDLRRWSNLYSLDSSLFNDPANKTFNNRKEAVKDAFASTYLPNDKKIVEGLNRWLAPLFEGRTGTKLVIEQDVSHVEALQEDKDKGSQRDERKSREVTKILQSIGKPIEMGGITKEAAIIMLTDIHDFDIDKAELMVK